MRWIFLRTAGDGGWHSVVRVGLNILNQASIDTRNDAPKNADLINTTDLFASNLLENKAKVIRIKRGAGQSKPKLDKGSESCSEKECSTGRI